VLFGTIALIILSFWSLDLQLARVLSLESLARMGKFLGELLSPNLEPVFLSKLLRASLETLAMSAVGTLLATIFGLLLAVPASRSFTGDPARWRFLTRLLLNALRAIPELVWAALLLISAGLGPFAGTLALALDTDPGVVPNQKQGAKRVLTHINEAYQTSYTSNLRRNLLEINGCIDVYRVLRVQCPLICVTYNTMLGQEGRSEPNGIGNRLQR
jgi:ABC-type phosphate/phosphonate transport system permease subunit